LCHKDWWTCITDKYSLIPAEICWKKMSVKNPTSCRYFRYLLGISLCLAILSDVTVNHRHHTALAFAPSQSPSQRQVPNVQKLFARQQFEDEDAHNDHNRNKASNKSRRDLIHDGTSIMAASVFGILLSVSTPSSIAFAAEKVPTSKVRVLYHIVRVNDLLFC
jgi:hypothetical protein